MMKNFIKSNLPTFNSIRIGSALLFIFISFSFTINAQAPATCLTAINIPIGTCVTPAAPGFNDFTVEGTSIVPTCFNNIFRREGWYSFTVPGGPNQNITVTAQSTSATSNMVIQVLSGTCGAETQIGCANYITTTSAHTEAVSLPNLAPGTYFIRIMNYGNAVNMLGTVCVNSTPANDDCANAQVIAPLAASASCGGIAGTTAGATQQSAIPASCTAANTTNDDVWYTFTTTASSHVITVTPSASMNAVFEVYSSTPCGGAGASLGCTNLNGVGGVETLTMTGLGIGVQYWIRVYDFGTGIPASSAFTICIQTPPPNDDCANAVVLTPTATCTPTAGDVNVASNSGIAAGAACPGSNPDDDVWYSFVATGTSHTITVAASATFDPGFEVFSGACPGGLVSVLCNAPGSVPGTTISSSIATSIGTTYWVRVYDYNVGSPGSTGFNICILNPPPANDNCAGAVSLTPSVACVPTTGNVSGATQSLVGCAGIANDDVWYSFTTSATAGQQYVVTVVGSASFDPVFQVYSTSCGGTSINCTNANATAGGTETTTLSGLAVSTTYWVRVYDAAGGYPATTTFTICITLPPTNNDCNGPTIFVYGTAAAPAYCGGNTAGTLAGATASGQATLCGGTPNDDVWYNFVATSTTNIVTVVPCATMNVVVQAYSTSCGGTSIGCANATGVGGTETLTLSGITVGSTYWIRVYDFTGTSACNTFTICVATPPVNDPCASATTLTPAFNCNLISGTVVGGTISLPANCGGTVTSDVWYTFIAGSSNQTITVNGSSGINIVYELFSTNPCGGAGTSLGCINATGLGGNESFAWTTLTGGAQYWVRVYDFSGAPTTSAFAICVVTPSNDLCANATTAVCGGVYTGCTTAACGITGTGDPTALCVAATTPAQGVWYVLTGTGQNVVATTCGGTTNYDTQLFIYTGTCGSLTCLTGNDDMCNPGCVGGVTCGYPQASRVTFSTTVGTLYYIFVSGWSGGTGNYTLTITCSAPPPNDQCTGAITVNCGGSITGSTITATNIGDITGCGSATAVNPIALWYLFTGDSTYLTVNVCGGTTNFDTQLGVWSAANCSSGFTCVAGNDNTGGCAGSGAGNASSVTFITTQGVNYYIEVFGAYSGLGGNGSQYGNFTLNLSGGTNPGNAALTGCAPLPIALLSFTGQAQGTRNLIEWKTATETNNDYFTIERADDAISFMTLIKVNGAGNSTSTLSYQTYDNSPVNGTTYYRLKQTDYNGAYTYSAIISIDNKMDKVNLFNVHPNPTSSDINFDFYSTSKGKINIQVLDYLGRIMQEETQNVSDGSSQLTTKINSLAPGVYSLKVYFDQTGFVSVTKVAKD